MYEKILIALDGSKAAEIPIPYVEEIASHFDTEIILLGIVQTTLSGEQAALQSYLKQMAEWIREDLPAWGAKRIAVRTDIIAGHPADEILRYSDDETIGVIAMSSQGSSGAGPWLLGSSVHKIILSTTKPVLLVRFPANEVDLRHKELVRRIMLPLDGSPEHEAAIPYAQVLAKALGAQVVLFQVVGPPRDLNYREAEDRISSSVRVYLHNLRQKLQDEDIFASDIVSSGSPANRIIDYAAASEVDLITIVMRHRSGIERWIFGSVTDKLLHAGDLPLLLIPAKVE